MEINRLTKDEDLQQDLWLYFLSGNSPFTFEEYLNKLKLKQEKELYAINKFIDSKRL
jgi:hypothetical protein